MDAFPPAGRAPPRISNFSTRRSVQRGLMPACSTGARHLTAPIGPALSHKPDLDANPSIITEGLIGVLSSLIWIVGLGHWKVADSFSIRID